MSWLKIDDQFPDHPKVVEAGPLASWLHVCGMAYCARYLTDGFIPGGQIRKLADVDNASDLAAKLVQAGLWETVDGGFVVHDYLDYNPSAEEVKAKRRAGAKRQEEWRNKQRAENGHYVSNAVTDTLQTLPVTPIPSPSPSPSPSPIPFPVEEDPPPPVFQEAVAIWEDLTGRITDRTRQQFAMAADEYGEERLLYAVQEAHDHNAKSWAYVEAVLEGKGKARDSPDLTPTDIARMRQEYYQDEEHTDGQ